MRVLYAIFLLGFISCVSPDSGKIVVPKLHASFYEDGLKSIEQELSSEPNDQQLIKKKLFYCEQLGWPVSCISALDVSRRTNGMTNQLFKNYITYYIEHEEHDLLLDFIDKWIEEYELKEEFNLLYIESLVKSEKIAKASLELRQYLIDHQSDKDILFAARQYLDIGDSIMAAYNLGKVYERHPSDDMMWDYGVILVKMGYLEVGLPIMKEYANKKESDLNTQLVLANILANNKKNREARKLVKPFVEQSDTVAYLLARWFIKEQMWDSASLVFERLIMKDSSNRTPIWKAGRLYEDRGWFSTSMSYYEHLIELDSLDTLAQQRIDLIQRKIAYLQRLKFEESKIPTIELKPKKIEN